MKITSERASQAFMAKAKFKSANTLTENGKLFLHGNLIARHNDDNKSFIITNAGWFSQTTKERLNALPGVKIHQVKGEWYLNGQKWNGQPATIQYTRFYYFNVKATEAHDGELAIIEAKSLVEAIKEFGAMHPEDIENIDQITSDTDQDGTDAQIEVN